MPNLRNGTTYFFQVKAVNIHGASEASNPIELIPVTRPAAPYDFEAEGGDAQVELAWTVPDNGGDAIIRHQYQQSEDSQGFGQWQDIPDSAETGNNKDNYIVTNLANGTLYNFQVRAVNTKEGGGDVSDPKSARPEVPATSPSPPRELEFDAGNGQVTLKWKPSLSDGGSPITKHQYQQKVGTGNWGGWNDIPDSAPSNGNNKISYKVTGLGNVLFTLFR